MDYSGNQIQNLTGPYLKYSGTIGTSGTGAPIIVWQDVNGMVSNLSVAETTTEDGYLKFYIAPNKIAEGNAVLAVKNSSGTIMWSWHIWVTVTDIMQTVHVKTRENSAYTANTYYLMPIMLGWAYTGTFPFYKWRYTQIKLKQPSTGKTATAYIEQQSHSIPSNTTGYCPYYEWGRKDAFPPCSGTDKTGDAKGRHTFYLANGTSSTTITSETYNTIGYSIQHPLIWLSGPSSVSYYWCTTVHIDFWNTSMGNNWGYNFNPVTKSVYDPCPYAFKIPVTKVFTNVTTTGVEIQDGTKNTYNVPGGSSATFNNKGWNFYTGYDSETFYLPAVGWTSLLGEVLLASIGGGHRSWTSGSELSTGLSGTGIWYNTPAVSSGNSTWWLSPCRGEKSGAWVSYGFTVMPMQE